MCFVKKARFSDLAELDLTETWFYIARDNPSAADRLVERILKTCDLLAQGRHAGEGRDDLSPGARIFTVAPYVVVFRPSEEGIEVIRVIHSARDIDSLF